MNPVIEMMGNNMLWIMIGSVAITATVLETIKVVSRNNARERSRREIAAYIAEGSMTPEQGEKLMKAVPDEND